MPSERKPIVRCHNDFELAGERVAELGMPLPGSDEEVELYSLLEAMEKWEARHEDDDGESWG